MEISQAQTLVALVGFVGLIFIVISYYGGRAAGYKAAMKDVQKDRENMAMLPFVSSRRLNVEQAEDIIQPRPVVVGNKDGRSE